MKSIKRYWIFKIQVLVFGVSFFVEFLIVDMKV